MILVFWIMNLQITSLLSQKCFISLLFYLYYFSFHSSLKVLYSDFHPFHWITLNKAWLSLWFSLPCSFTSWYRTISFYSQALIADCNICHIIPKCPLSFMSLLSPYKCFFYIFRFWLHISYISLFFF